MQPSKGKKLASFFLLWCMSDLTWHLICQLSAVQTDVDCGFYVWYDPEHTTFMKNLLLDLRNAVWELRSKAEEIAELKQINDLLSSENKEKVLVLKAQEKDLEEKNKQLVVLANRISSGSRCSLFCCGFVMLLVGLFVGMMLGAI